VRLGLLGAGSIAHVVVDALLAGHLEGVTLVGVAGRELGSPRAAALAQRIDVVATELEGLLARQPDWILEAAGGAAVREHALPIVERGPGLIALSSGGLVDPLVYRAVTERRLLHGRIVVPSGGIAGLDGVAALAAAGGLRRVGLTTFKPPASLRSAPFVQSQGVVLSDSDAHVVFDGSLREAILGFPANINVGATLSLYGLGPERTMVKIVSDPQSTTIRHVIEAEGEAGSLSLEVRSLPNPRNAASSYLAALSAVAAVQQVRDRSTLRG